MSVLTKAQNVDLLHITNENSKLPDPLFYFNVCNILKDHRFF